MLLFAQCHGGFTSSTFLGSTPAMGAFFFVVSIFCSWHRTRHTPHATPPQQPRRHAAQQAPRGVQRAVGAVARGMRGDGGARHLVKTVCVCVCVCVYVCVKSKGTLCAGRAGVDAGVGGSGGFGERRRLAAEEKGAYREGVDNGHA